MFWKPFLGNIAQLEPIFELLKNSLWIAECVNQNIKDSSLNTCWKTNLPRNWNNSRSWYRTSMWGHRVQHLAISLVFNKMLSITKYITNSYATHQMFTLRRLNLVQEPINLFFLESNKAWRVRLLWIFTTNPFQFLEMYISMN